MNTLTGEEANVNLENEVIAIVSSGQKNLFKRKKVCVKVGNFTTTTEMLKDALLISLKRRIGTDYPYIHICSAAHSFRFLSSPRKMLVSFFVSPHFANLSSLRVFFRDK